MCSAKDIVAVIEEYAGAYAKLQRCQEESYLLPEGDQKTGSIGEFYARLYLQDVYSDASMRWGRLCEKGWDIEVTVNDQRKRVQVKTVSAYSRTRIISPVHCGWDELFLVYLGRDLRPEGFWIIEDNSIVLEGEVLRNLKCCTPDGSCAASRLLSVGDNRIRELQEAIERQLTTLGVGGGEELV